MASFDFNLSNDSFVLDRDQAAYLNNPAAQSTPKTLYNSHSAEQSPIIQDVYEIINTGGGTYRTLSRNSPSFNTLNGPR